MLDSTLVVVLSDFGRTPKVNPSAGRDHWSTASVALLAGGGHPARRRRRPDQRPRRAADRGALPHRRPRGHALRPPRHPPRHHPPDPRRPADPGQLRRPADPRAFVGSAVRTSSVVSRYGPGSRGGVAPTGVLGGAAAPTEANFPQVDIVSVFESIFPESSLPGRAGRSRENLIQPLEHQGFAENWLRSARRPVRASIGAVPPR